MKKATPEIIFKIRNDAISLGMLSLIYSFKLYICQDPRVAPAYAAHNTNESDFSLVSLSDRPRIYRGGPFLQATLPRLCRACLVSHPWQLLPYAVLGIGRDAANNLASSRLESWAVDDSSVEIMSYSVLDSTKCPHKHRNRE